MIEVDFYKRQEKLILTVNGHAGYAPKGFDIVCAGISSLCGALVCQLEALEKQGLARELSFELGDGYFRCYAEGEKDSGFYDHALQAFALTLRGIELIESGYPAHVKLCRGLTV